MLFSLMVFKVFKVFLGDLIIKQNKKNPTKCFHRSHFAVDVQQWEGDRRMRRMRRRDGGAVFNGSAGLLLTLRRPEKHPSVWTAD